MARQQAIQSYYPSARVRLIIRFEDYGKDGTPKPPETPPQQRRGKKDQSKDKLKVVNQDGVLLLIGPGDNPNAVGTPQEQLESDDGLTHAVDGIIPITASHSQNGIRTADTLNVEIEFADFPIDPRVIRSCAIQYFLGTVSPDDFQKGIEGELRTGKGPANARVPYNVVPDEYTDSNGQPRTNLRFEGWVDTWEADWPEGSSPKVVFECTDNTRILIEQDHPPRLAISVDDPLDKAVANYLSNFPQFRGIGVRFDPPGSDIPNLKTALTKQAYPPGVGPSAGNAGDSKLSVWDYLTDVISSVGFNIRLDGTVVLIQRPRALYNRRFPSRREDPFQGRDIPGQGNITNRLMVYGQNILEMKWKRSFTKYAPLNIEVRCYNPRRKKTLVARFPSKESLQKRLNPGESADQKFYVITKHGIQDEAILRAIAQQTYEQMGRNEILVSVITKNLGSYGGGNLDPDLLDAKVGDAVDIVVQRGNLSEDDQNTVTTVQGELVSRPQEFLERLGFPTEFAKAYAKALNDANFLTTFRMKEIHTDWDKASDGVRLDFDSMNYIEVRADAELPTGEEQQPEAAAPEHKTVVVKDQVGT